MSDERIALNENRSQKNEQRIDKHDSRIGALELWRAWLTGGVAVASMVGVWQWPAAGAAGADGIGCPVGAVIAWPGEIGPKSPAPDGFHLCDGTPLEQVPIEDAERVALRKVLANDLYRDCLPDYRGYFLRGENLTSPRQTKPLGDPQGDAVGTHTTSSKGLGVLEIRDQTHPAHGGAGPGKRRITGDSGTEYRMTIEGDVETRPVNVAVNWIIRVR